MAKPTKEMTRRKAQLEEISGIVEKSQAQLGTYKAQSDKHKLLLSVASGLYEEVDKVSKKAPAEPVTNLVYEEVNQVIKESKELTPNDAYMQRLKQFVAAGENPPYRDVVVALKLLLQGLKRFHESLYKLELSEAGRIYEGKAVQSALRYYSQNEANASASILRDMNTPAPDEWLDGYPSTFDFHRLDRMDIATYFSAAHSSEQ